MVGGGFIGLEVAENLRELGLDVTIVQRPMQLMNPFDRDMASFIHGEMRKHGVKLLLGRSVEGFAERDGGVDVHLEDAQKLPRDGSVTLLDTRTEGEYHRGHIDGFKNIPVDELRERIGEIEAGKPVYVICQSGLRSYIATRILEGYGFEAYNFAGGFRFYDAVMNDRALTERSLACGMDQ